MYFLHIRVVLFIIYYVIFCQAIWNKEIYKLFVISMCLLGYTQEYACDVYLSDVSVNCCLWAVIGVQDGTSCYQNPVSISILSWCIFMWLMPKGFICLVHYFISKTLLCRRMCGTIAISHSTHMRPIHYLNFNRNINNDISIQENRLEYICRPECVEPVQWYSIGIIGTTVCQHQGLPTHYEIQVYVPFNTW